MSIIGQVYAQDGICNPVLAWTCGNKDPGVMLGTMISSFLSLALTIAGIITMFFLITGGIMWITSGGDKTGLEAARNRIMHAIIGLIVTAASYAIMLLVFTWLGVPFPNLPIPSISREIPTTTPTRECRRDDACGIEVGSYTCIVPSTGNPGSCVKQSDNIWYCCVR